VKKGEVYTDVQTRDLQGGDRLLLCSDGLTNTVHDTQIAQLLRTHAEPETACRMLICAANASGGTDNIMALVVDCTEGEANHGNAREAGMQKQKS